MPGAADLVLAVDVGGTSIKGELLDGSLRQTVATCTVPTPDGPAALDAVLEVGERLVALGGAAVRAAGIALPGIVDVDQGRAVWSATLGWRDLPVRDAAAARLDMPVAIEHDVAAAGQAERSRGAGRGVDDLLVVVIGTGLSAVVYTAGHLVRGGRGQAGELGHVQMVVDGRACGCGGRGCLETIASARAIAEQYQLRSGRPVQGAREVLAALQAGDPDAHAVWHDAVAALADALLAAIALLGTDRVVVGGGLSEAGEALLGPLRRALTERRTVQVLPDVVVAELGPRAGTVGAGLAARALLGSAA